MIKNIKLIIKKFFPSAEETHPLVENMGGCIATDKITVEGHPVRFMYREQPDNDIDSGWRFMSGLESDEYMDNPDNHAVYDVNTIANYDKTIIPHLNAPINSAFEKVPGAKDFSEVFDYSPPND